MYRSKLKMLVPTIGIFFTPLHLREAFLTTEPHRAISQRRFVAPSFNGIPCPFGYWLNRHPEVTSYGAITRINILRISENKIKVDHFRWRRNPIPRWFNASPRESRHPAFTHASLTRATYWNCHRGWVFRSQWCGIQSSTFRPSPRRC